MATEADELEWLLRSGNSRAVLHWDKLGPVTWSAGTASMPIAPAVAGIYMIKLLRSVRDFARKEWPCGQFG